MCFGIKIVCILLTNLIYRTIDELIDYLSGSSSSSSKTSENIIYFDCAAENKCSKEG